MAYYNCLLFDMDGTLLDFDASEDAAIRETLEHFNFDDIEKTVEIYKDINAKLWEKLGKGELKQDRLVTLRFEQLFSAIGKQGNAIDMNKYYLTALSNHCDVYPGAEETLNDLAEVATLAIVSNGIELVQKKRLKDSGLDKYFDAVAISAQVGAPKPARKMFDVVLNELGVEKRERVLVIGDSLITDIKGGKNAGLATCYYNREDKDLPEDALKPDYVIRGYEELLRIVMEEDELANVGSTEKRHQL